MHSTMCDINQFDHYRYNIITYYFIIYHYCYVIINMSLFKKKHAAVLNAGGGPVLLKYFNIENEVYLHVVTSYKALTGTG